METSLIPAVLDALVTIATEHVDTSVSDGYRVGEEYPEFHELMIGVDDAVSSDRADAGQSSQEWAYTGTTEREERGSVTCVAMGYDADASMADARDRVWKVVDELFTAIAADATLGLPNLQWARPGEQVTYLQDQDASGAVAAVVFQVAFYGIVP